PIITTKLLKDGVVETFYTARLVATGTLPITWELAKGSELPKGLSLNHKTGVINGTPTLKETVKFTVNATNSEGSVSKEFTITIEEKAVPGIAPKITTTSLNKGAIGVSYLMQLTATGDETILWLLESGSLPQGLSLSETGEISGTPTEKGTATFKVKASNSAGEDAKKLTIIVEEESKVPSETDANSNQNNSFPWLWVILALLSLVGFGAIVAMRKKRQ
ncbi:MAG: Ig domain-containing protein, partial [Oscillospiraceae bacterium]